MEGVHVHRRRAPSETKSQLLKALTGVHEPLRLPFPRSSHPSLSDNSKSHFLLEPTTFPKPTSHTAEKKWWPTSRETSRKRKCTVQYIWRVKGRRLAFLRGSAKAVLGRRSTALCKSWGDILLPASLVATYLGVCVHSLFFPNGSCFKLWVPRFYLELSSL